MRSGIVCFRLGRVFYRVAKCVEARVGVRLAVFKAHLRAQGVGTAALGLAILVEPGDGARARIAKNEGAPKVGHEGAGCIVPSVGV